MKKNISLIVSVVMIVTLIFMFPASASADDTIIYNLYEAHSEIYIDLLDGGNTASRTVTFTVPYNGWYIIQTMEFPSVQSNDATYNGHNGTITLRDSDGQRIPEDRVSGTGYGEGKLLHCELSAYEIYTLRLGFSDAVAARLVITYAEGLFDRSAPISRYSHITSFEPDVIEFSYTESTHQYAQVALIEHSGDVHQDFSVDVDGTPFDYFMLLDPRVLDHTGSMWVYSGSTVSLEANVPYFLVVFLEQGDVPIDFPLEVTVTFTPIE